VRDPLSPIVGSALVVSATHGLQEQPLYAYRCPLGRHAASSSEWRPGRLRRARAEIALARPRAGVPPDERSSPAALSATRRHPDGPPGFVGDALALPVGGGHRGEARLEATPESQQLVDELCGAPARRAPLDGGSRGRHTSLRLPGRAVVVAETSGEVWRRMQLRAPFNLSAVVPPSRA
jgi:hypothetical protein